MCCTTPARAHQVIGQGLYLLANLTEDQGHVQPKEALPAIRVTAHALRTHPADATVQGNGLAQLSNFASMGPVIIRMVEVRWPHRPAGSEKSSSLHWLFPSSPPLVRHFPVFSVFVQNPKSYGCAFESKTLAHISSSACFPG